MFSTNGGNGNVLSRAGGCEVNIAAPLPVIISDVHALLQFDFRIRFEKLMILPFVLTVFLAAHGLVSNDVIKQLVPRAFDPSLQRVSKQITAPPASGLEIPAYKGDAVTKAIAVKRLSGEK
jgi:hypothetical protein